jgi:hypothetical protein
MIILGKNFPGNFHRDEFAMKSPAKKIAIVAHSAGGSVNELMN